MSDHPRRRRRLGIVAFAALALVLCLPAAASADTIGSPPQIFPADSRGATITVSPSAVILAKVVAVVHVEVTCDPFEVFDWGTGETVLVDEGSLEFMGVDLLQASGRTLNWGSTDASTGRLLVCDGETVNAFDLSVAPQGPAWRQLSCCAGLPAPRRSGTCSCGRPRRCATLG
jgi:hypothetical protein